MISVADWDIGCSIFDMVSMVIGVVAGAGAVICVNNRMFKMYFGSDEMWKWWILYIYSHIAIFWLIFGVAIEQSREYLECKL